MRDAVIARFAAGLARVVVGGGGALLAASCGPSAECAAYVACQRAVDDSVDVTAWGAGGVCWQRPQTGAACTAQCSAALEALRLAPDLPAACLDDDG